MVTFAIGSAPIYERKVYSEPYYLFLEYTCAFPRATKAAIPCIYHCGPPTNWASNMDTNSRSSMHPIVAKT